MEFSKKDKLKIVRDIMIRMPDINKYGYNKEVIEIVNKKFGFKLTDSYVSRLISEVRREWAENTEKYMSKKELIDRLIDLLGKCKTIFEQRAILQEIGKLEGHYVLKFEGTNDMNVQGKMIMLNSKDEKLVEKELNELFKK